LSNGITIDLVVPGLFGSSLLIGDEEYRGRYPVLEKFVSRGRRFAAKGEDFSTTLLQLFGIPVVSANDLPVAPFCRLADGGETDETFWLIAAPVYLRADRDRLLLFDSVDLEFSRAEAAELAQLFKEHFKAQGWRLEALSASRWYLGLEQVPHITTSHLDNVQGRSIDAFLPKGRDAGRWHGILNEVQMLFHNAGVNRDREERGLAPINSLWFYGGGHFTPPPSSEYQVVGADSELARGLATAAGVRAEKLYRDLTVDLPARGRVLLVHEAPLRSLLNGDAEGWLEGLDVVEELVAGLESELRSGVLSAVNIHACDGSLYRVDKRGLKCFWKRARPFLGE
jgi:hypothetical protein